MLDRCWHELKGIYVDLLQLAQNHIAGALHQGGSTVAACRAFLQQRLNDATSNPSRFLQVATDLHAALHSAFNKVPVVKEVLDAYPDARKNAEFAEDFGIHAQELEDALRPHVQAVCIAKAYEELMPEFRAFEAQKTMVVPKLFDRGLTAAWEDYRREDENSDSWYGDDFPSFVQFNPFLQVASTATPLFTGTEYVEMLEEKMKTCSKQAAHCVRKRVCKRLEEMVTQATKYIRANARQHGAVNPLWEQRLQAFEAYGKTIA
jgi:hypothetical protein